ncbi:MAG: chemotaxis protein CheW [Burkholderiales bacterium]|nr:chemotaxis protein CheW [Burkholderiales bacterium]
MTIDMSQFYQVFFEESAELLEEMERLLLELDVADAGKDALNAIFRTAHSIKGGSATFGFTEITETTHILESLLDKLRNGELPVRVEMVDVFLKAVDVIKNQLAGRQYESAVDDQAVAEICRQLSAFAQEGPAEAVVQTSAAQAPQADAVATPAPAADDAEPVDPTPENLFAILTGAKIAVAPVAAAAPVPGAAGAAASDAYGFFTEVAPAQAKAPVPPPAPAADQNPGRRATDAAGDAPPKRGRRASDHVDTETTSIRVGVEKVDQLINLVGELVITQAMLAQTASHVDSALYEALRTGMAQLEHNTRDLQESVMSIRMMPISFVFSRFPRVVRDLAGSLNKQVELKTVGEGTELDKGLIEKIADPLNHLVRNSLDHGVESPEKRLAAGKPAMGTITLRAFHQGGNIVIEVSDDGAGLNREKILAKARERGMTVSDDMPDQDVWLLIFEAGFSTAEAVTAVSGRGVGMDVVKRNIYAMGGRVEIDSTLGVGTRISIRLPLTLAILDGMSVSVGEEIFIVPLTFIVESLQPAKDDIKTITGMGTVVHVRGEYLPVVALYDVLNVRPKVTELDRGIMVIVESEGAKSAMFVDDLLGQHQVVIKSLETNYRKVPGVSGATIMGDGKVALILDVEALARGTFREEERRAA